MRSVLRLVRTGDGRCLLTPTDLNRRLLERAGWRLYEEKRGEFTLQYALAPGSPDPWMSVRHGYHRDEYQKRCRFLTWKEFDPGRFDGKTVDYLTDHPALMGLLGRLTEAQGRQFVRHLIEADQRYEGSAADVKSVEIGYVFAMLTTPLPILAECLWRVVGEEEVK